MDIYAFQKVLEFSILDVSHLEMFANRQNLCLGKIVPCRTFKNMLWEIFAIFFWICEIRNHYTSQIFPLIQSVTFFLLKLLRYQGQIIEFS